jgi:Ca-activated chloride channel family protein
MNAQFNAGILRSILSVLLLAFITACGSEEPKQNIVQECYEHDEYESSSVIEHEAIEEILENPIDSGGRIIGKNNEGGKAVRSIPDLEPVNDIIGVGGGAGASFSGKYRRRAVKGGGKAARGGRAGRARTSSGGTHTVNNEAYDLQFFKTYGVNPLVDTDDDPFSTFAVDVDTGAYTICRRFIEEGNLPKKEAVRVEEFVNYFDYDYSAPDQGDFAAHIEGGPSPFAANRRLMAIGLKAREIDLADRKDAVLTFVIDESGSMKQDNRLGLVKLALRLVIEQLRPADRIGIAAYGSRGRIVLSHTAISEGKRTILRAIDSLQPHGSTNAAEGINIGYDMAMRELRAGCINRVVLCSDGVANVGITDADSIFALIKKHVRKGIDLTTVGFGMDNYNDVLMEQLGNKGNGHYAYVDDLDEARRIFVEGLCGTLQVIARDVKVQVEFNPAAVRSYRLVGYENRDVADRDFRNETVDGGEVGAGHAVTAIYEIKLWEDRSEKPPLGWVRIRYKHPDYQDEVSEYEAEIRREQFHDRRDEASVPFRLAACVTQFAELARKSCWARDLAMAAVANEASSLAAMRPGDQQVRELKELLAKATRLVEAEEARFAHASQEDARRVDLEKVDSTDEGR